MSETNTMEAVAGIGDDAYKLGFHYPEHSIIKTKKGLSEEVVREISAAKGEAAWMLEFRLAALETFRKMPMPGWGSDLSGIDFDDYYYYAKPVNEQSGSWEELPQDIRDTYERLGIPEAERRFLGGVGAQYDSEMVYHKIRKDFESKGILFMDTETGEREHEELFRKYFASVVPSTDNKFAALNAAVWSGGSFVYVPKGVKVDIPLQAYFRINTKSLAQFERTLIVVDEGAFVHYIEGCTAPIYAKDSLHTGVVEIVALPGARVRYSTIQNWSTNVYNLVTQRAKAHAGASVEWVDGNIGSKSTMKYPCVVLAGEGAHGEVLSIAFAGRGQEQDAGGKMIHLANNTSSVITSKSISKDGGISSYRGLVKVAPHLRGVKSKVECDALILDEKSTSNTYPTMDIQTDDVRMEHEAKVSKISEEELFYLQSRGIDEEEAAKMIVAGFIDPLVRELPMEYAVELNRLIDLEMEGAVG
ncbi:Fe-S cluster assembly protein SufB [Sediminispirochaeta smaragdinae]|jgi:Fe-S cluster assembly protein SufB|uniref:FeS assembly protein SufB n=1 Tax=Sediminispirochaeta smaragdinae (strain DSM 11293 / JCM 15392 / SEBR 4228) TaxID=573413 RepID=E1R6U0_SEDSS|nr:Fe-S cluster assembly protein SufB [Sediminispirochaeta smaragdinae]ADK79222.1 FeS assembly protein SufB [Sediminispirochaeta smaragdinae DSM 11293]